ncbi:hypothetical protein BDR05DRAFT_951284 [Suillus weaverae]|nr:hypothetical protein BDR05DRAFT_951284 [Suillus weaverae]
MHGLTLPTAGNPLIVILAALLEFGAMANLGATHTDIICTSVFVIYEAQKDINIEHIADKVKALLGGPIATLDEKVDQLEDILVKYKREMEKVITEDLMEAQLVAKAALVIEILTKDKVEIPEGLIFLSAKRLPHRGVLYKLNLAESAIWFNTPMN